MKVDSYTIVLLKLFYIMRRRAMILHRAHFRTNISISWVNGTYPPSYISKSEIATLVFKGNCISEEDTRSSEFICEKISPSLAKRERIFVSTHEVLFDSFQSYSGDKRCKWSIWTLEDTSRVFECLWGLDSNGFDLWKKSKKIEKMGTDLLRLSFKLELRIISRVWPAKIGIDFSEDRG